MTNMTDTNHNTHDSDDPQAAPPADGEKKPKIIYVYNFAKELRAKFSGNITAKSLIALCATLGFEGIVNDFHQLSQEQAAAILKHYSDTLPLRRNAKSKKSKERSSRTGKQTRTAFTGDVLSRKSATPAAPANEAAGDPAADAASASDTPDDEVPATPEPGEVDEWGMIAEVEAEKAKAEEEEAERYVAKFIFPQHLEKLRKSALSNITIKNREYKSTSDRSLIKKILGREFLADDLGDFLVIPYHDRNGERLKPLFWRVRPDKPHPPKDPNGKPGKYLSPSNAGTRIRISRNAGKVFDDPKSPICITEGELKTDCIDEHVMPCIGLPGVSCWSKPRPEDPKTKKKAGKRELHEDLACIAWKGRTVYIVFDSDYVSNENVRRELLAFAKALKAKGAIVLIVTLPSTKDGEKQGADDYIYTEGADEFRKRLAEAKNIDQTIADDQFTIIISVKEYLDNAKALCALRREKDLYQHGGYLAHIIETTIDTETAMIRRPAGAIAVRRLPPSLLRERLTRCADWMEWVGSGENAKLVPAHPPKSAVMAIMDRGDWPGINRLDTVVAYPVMLPDGSILCESGYQEKYQLYASIPATLKINVPDKPSKDDVTAAVNVLFDVVSNFPFENKSHRSAFLAALLSPLAYHAFDGCVPMFLIDGNTRGVGKGLLADVIALTVLGRRFSTMSYTNDKEELRKKITTLAIEGESMVLFDNLAGHFGNDILDNALTSNRWKDRILGGNTNYDGPLNLCYYSTGNNVQIHADTARRICSIRMETPEERPETKADFKYPDLRRHILENRSKLLSAALTILRGWHVAWRPKHNLTPWGSYEGWSAVVREAIVFAGLDDPGLTRLAVQETADRDAIAMAAILDGIQQMDPGGHGVTAAQIIATVTPSKRANDPPLPDWAIDFGEAIEEICGKKCSRTLGCRLRHFKHRTLRGDRCLTDDGGKNHSKTNRWTVVDPQTRKGSAGYAGFAGDVSANLEKPQTEPFADKETGHGREVTPHTPHTPQREDERYDVYGDDDKAVSA